MGSMPENMRIGIIGAGQLARMTYQAGIALGLTVRLLADTPEDAAALIGADVETGSPKSQDALLSFAESCDVITFEHELINPDDLDELEKSGHLLRPSASVARTVFDKRLQREIMVREGLPVPAYTEDAKSADDIIGYASDHGWPVVVKRATGGYDGRGVWVLKDETEARELEDELHEVPFLIEDWVAIERELAVQVVRSPSGECVTYPVVETVQRDGVCHEVLAPAHINNATDSQARNIARQLANALGLVGVMAVELFMTKDGLLINELAVRPHNSGHHTIEGCVTSQFENHLRAVLDLPLGEVGLTGPAVAMANVFGAPDGFDLMAGLRVALGIPGTHVHIYAKETRPGRKLGHVTVVASDLELARSRAVKAAAALMGKELSNGHKESK